MRFDEMLSRKKFLLLDGATGSNLMRAGLPEGVCVEQWALAHPEALLTLQSAYVQAGAQVLYTATFGANEARLARFGLAGETEELNLRLAALTRRAANGRALVAGDVSPTGLFVEPFGTAAFEEVCGIYRRQVGALARAGVDLIVAETMMCLSDARAAVFAARECGLPALVSVTLDENGRTAFGTDAEGAATALEAAGACVVGFNCSVGPQKMAAALQKARAAVRVPLLAKPNAGTPEAPLSPEEFAAAVPALAGAGARVIGGCCQSTPAHIAAVRDRLASLEPPPGGWDGHERLCSETKLFYGPFSRLSAPLACDDALEDALFSAADGEAQAVRLEIDCLEDARRFAAAAYLSPLPVAVHAADETLLESALRLYQGRAAAVCDTDEERRAAQKYGALVL